MRLELKLKHKTPWPKDYEATILVDGHVLTTISMHANYHQIHKVSSVFLEAGDGVREYHLVFDEPVSRCIAAGMGTELIFLKSGKPGLLVDGEVHEHLGMIEVQFRRGYRDGNGKSSSLDERSLHVSLTLHECRCQFVLTGLYTVVHLPDVRDLESTYDHSH